MLIYLFKQPEVGSLGRHPSSCYGRNRLRGFLHSSLSTYLQSTGSQLGVPKAGSWELRKDTKFMDSHLRGNDRAVCSFTLTTSLQKIPRVNSCLFQDRSQCSFWHIPGVIRYRSVTTRRVIEPNLVASGSLAVKTESKCSQPFDNTVITKSPEFSHATLLSYNQGVFKMVSE